MRLFLVVYALLMLGCKREIWTPANQARIDSAAKANGIVGKKIFFEAPVTFTTQTGEGNIATSTASDNTKAGQRSGSAATAENAKAATETTKQGTPWQLYLLAVVAGAVGWEYFSRKVPIKWLPWRVRPG